MTVARPGAGSGPARFAATTAGVLGAAVVLTGALAAFVPSVRLSHRWLWGPSWPVTTQELFQMLPRPNALLLDEEVYLGTLDGARRGAGIYQAQHDILNTNPGRWDTYSPLTYRQPLLTQLWLLLRSGGVIGIAWSILAALSMFMAYRAAAVLVRPLHAVLAPFALGLLYGLMEVHSPRLLYAETWAAPLLVIANATAALLLTEAASPQARPGRLRSLGALGAMSALLALLVRELALVPVVFVILALVADNAARARRLWIPWIASVVAWAAAYFAHAAQVRTVSLGDPAPPATPGGFVAGYFHPGPSFLMACLRWVSTTPWLLPVTAALCLMAVVGAITLRRTGLLVLGLGLTAATLALLWFAGTPGTYPDGSYTGYWGFLFLPIVVAWAPLAFRLLPAESGLPGSARRGRK